MMQGKLIALLGAAALTSGARAQNAAPLAERADNGMTVRINTAKWQRTAVPQPPRDWNQEESEHVFVLGFDVLKNGVALPAEKTLKDAESLRVVAINPNGERFLGGKWTQPLPDFYRTWTDLDPRWPLEFEFIVRDPQAPDDADGRFTDSVVWKDVPLPAAKDAVADIKREQTTTHGVSVLLDQIKLETVGHLQKKPLLLLTLRWQPPKALPDMAAKFNIDPSRLIDFQKRVVDDTGKALRPQINSTSWLRTGDSSTYTLICEEPSPDAKSVTVTVNLQGFAPGLKQEKWFRRLRVKVPPQTIALPPVVSTAPPLATAETGGARVVLDGISASSNRNFIGRLRLENAIAPADGGTRSWVLRRLLLRDAQGQPLADWPDSALPTRENFWQHGSRPLPPGATGYSVLATAPMPRPPFPDKFGLEAQVEQRLVREFKADFADLPVPPVGQMANPDREVKIEKIGRLAVLSVAAFDKDNSPSPSLAQTVARGSLKPPAGLAVLLRMTPDNPEAPGSDQFFIGSRLIRSMTLGDDGTQDDAGTPLWRTTAWAQSDLDEITRKIPAGAIAYKTIYLLPPSPQAKTFRLRCDGLWTMAEQQQKVLLRDIQLPTPVPTP